MEEQKYLKRKEKALNGSNRKNLADVCFQLGTFYMEKMKYEKSARQFEESADIYGELGIKPASANSSRMVSEARMMLGEYDEALSKAHLYLSASRELQDKAEEQRALTTLGRVHLHQESAQTRVDSSKKSLESALKMFTKSLAACESCKGKIGHREMMDMRARSLYNIAITLERLGRYDAALEYLQKSTVLCKNNEFNELLTDCLITEGEIYLNKLKDFKKAIHCFNVASEHASRLENKVEKKCSILLLKADALCSITDFQSAKSMLLKAWKLKNPNSEERLQTEKKLKIVAAMCYTEDLLVTTNSNDYRAIKDLYEKMGDGACALKLYEKSVSYYLKMLDNAEKNGDSERELVPAYISLYQTYIDLKDYDKALEFSKKEYALNIDTPKEAITSLLNIAKILHMRGDFEKSEETLLKAKEEAQKKYPESEAKCIKELIKFYEKNDVQEKACLLKNQLGKSKKSESSGEESCGTDSDNNSPPDIGEDICIDDLTDFSANEDSEEISYAQTTRKRGRCFTVKKNSKGETQLHQACISGNVLLVTRLISQGHPVNVRDNAGWLPIHEACIHGNKAAVEILIKNGAHINDRGGTQCDGITPLYDAASNGHLSIVELLLDNGASPITKTDFGGTALDILKQWRKDATVSSSDHIFYETICERMHKALESVGETFDRKKSTPSEKISHSLNTKDSLRRNVDQADDISTFSRKKRFTISDSDDSDSSISSNSRLSENIHSNKHIGDKNEAVNQYKNAISLLRTKRNQPSNQYHKNVETKKQSALLDADDVGEDWLENDITQTNKRRKRQNSYVNSPVKRLSNEEKKSPQIDRGHSSNDIQCRNDIYSNETSNDSYDDFQSSGVENISPSDTSWGRLNEMKALKKKTSGLSLQRRKRQISLTNAGFSSFKVKPNSNLTDSVMICDEEPDSTTETTPLIFSSHKSLSLGHVNVIENVKNSNSSFSQSPTAIKVKVQNRLLLVPLPKDKIDVLTIDWLSKETSRRYYNIEGVQPHLQLQTSDGAILVDEDPLNIILGSSDLIAKIVSWNVPSLVDRYVECCAQNTIAVDNYVKKQFEESQATHVLQLSNVALLHIDTKCIFKALNHQSNLKSLILANNNLGKEGIKLLAQALPTISNIETINLRGNSIDWDGLRHFLLAFETATLPICPFLVKLDFSFNPLNDLGFKYVIKLSKYLKLQSLLLRACDITCGSNRSFDDFKLSNIEIIDLSFNQLVKSDILEIFNNINSDNVSVIDLEGLNLSGGLFRLFDNTAYSDLKDINLSRCNLLDSDITDLLKSIERCVNLRNINLSYNKELTLRSCKKIIQRGNITSLNLEGCSKIFQVVEDDDFTNELFDHTGRKLEKLIMTFSNSPIDIDLITKRLSVLWQNYWNREASVQICSYGKIILKKMIL